MVGIMNLFYRTFSYALLYQAVEARRLMTCSSVSLWPYIANKGTPFYLGYCLYLETREDCQVYIMYNSSEN